MTADDLREIRASIGLVGQAVEQARQHDPDPSLCLRAVGARLDVAAQYVDSALVLLEAHYASLPPVRAG